MQIVLYSYVNLHFLCKNYVNHVARKLERSYRQYWLSRSDNQYCRYYYCKEFHPSNLTQVKNKVNH